MPRITIWSLLLPCSSGKVTYSNAFPGTGHSLPTWCQHWYMGQHTGGAELWGFISLPLLIKLYTYTHRKGRATWQLLFCSSCNPSSGDPDNPYGRMGHGFCYIMAWAHMWVHGCINNVYWFYTPFLSQQEMSCYYLIFRSWLCWHCTTTMTTTTYHICLLTMHIFFLKIAIQNWVPYLQWESWFFFSGIAAEWSRANRHWAHLHVH